MTAKAKSTAAHPLADTLKRAETTKRLGLLQRLFPKVKVFAISGGSQLTHIDFLPIAKKLGALEIFAKPLDRALFLAKVREHLDTPSEPPGQTKTA
jgi:hypothetical protein